MSDTSPLLTVALPTFNRASQLERQLAWIADEIKAHASCEVLISDNHSADGTPEVIDGFRPAFKDTRLVTKRHEVNVGAVKNIASCIDAAQGDHVWVLSDDDTLRAGTLGRVLGVLAEQPELGLLTLNYRKRQVGTGETLRVKCYAVDDDQTDSTGRLFARCVEEDVFGVATTTAQVYRTDLAQQALASWPDGLSNIAVQIYWGAYCALKGGMRVTSDVLMDVWIGAHYFTGDPLAKFRLRFSDMADVARRMAEIGYPSEVGDEMVLRQVGMLPYSRRVILDAARQEPRATGAALLHWLRAVGRVGPRKLLAYLWKGTLRRVRPSVEGGGAG